jgi:IclR family pca regulon transcriptional regulator
MVVSYTALLRENALSDLGITKGARDMLSTPPAMPISESPARMARAIWPTAFHAGAAQPVDGGRGHLDRHAGQQQRHARDVAVILPRLVGAAVEDVVERRPVDFRIARHQRGDGHRREIVGADGRQGSGVAAEGRAHGVADEGVGGIHGIDLTMGESAAMTTKRSKASEPERAVQMPASEIAAFAGDPDFMTSLARGIAVVRAFTRSKRELTVAELARKTAISRASVRRCLYTLNKLGYVESDGRVFTLAPKVLSLGYSYLSSAPLTDIAQPVLERVSAAVQESCSLAVLDGDEIVYIARSATRRIMSVALNVGSRLPAYCTSMGRVALAQLPPARLEGYMSRVKLRPLTARTVISQPQLLRIVADGAARRVRRGRPGARDRPALDRGAGDRRVGGPAREHERERPGRARHDARHGAALPARAARRGARPALQLEGSGLARPSVP